MGKMKEWGTKLAFMIYERKMSDERIVSELMPELTKGGMTQKWLYDQIKIVRGNPQIYRNMANAKS